MSPVIDPLDGKKRFSKNTVEIPVLAVAYMEAERRDDLHVWYAVDPYGTIWTTESPLETPWKRYDGPYASLPSHILSQLLKPLVRRIRKYEDGLGALAFDGIMPRDPNDMIRVFKCSIDKKV